jgi:hypothetical protein
MSLYTDTKYLNQIGHRLENFKRKADSLYNCRCPICGDSTTNKKKSRGYFYKVNNDLFYKCHNCDASQHFGTFLKNFDASLYKQYALERYANGENRRPHANAEPDLKTQFQTPVFQPRPESDVLDELMIRVDRTEPASEVREFCRQRQIPEDQLHRLYVIHDIKRIETLHERYQNTIQTHEPRLVIPFRDQTGQLVAVSCRGMRDETLRYITVRISETAPLVFGLDVLDKQQHVYVCEGPIDSLFLDNCLAVGGMGFGKLASLGLDSQRLTVILDNQPRNAEVCKMHQRLIQEGYNLLIWPDYTSAKDLNELIMQTPGLDLKTFIDINTHGRLTAQLKFDKWKRI